MRRELRPRRPIAPFTCVPWAIAALLAACHGQKFPTVPQAQPAPALSIPLLPPPADPSVLAYLKVRDPAHFAAEIGVDDVRRLLNNKDLDFNLFRPATPATLLLWGPESLSLDKVPVGVFVPLNVPPPKAGSQDGGTQRVGDFTFVSITQPARAHAAAAPSLLPLASDPGPWDVQAYIALGTITQTYGTQLHMGLGAAQGTLLSQGRKPGAPDPQAMGAMLGRMLARIEKVDSYAVGLNLYPGEVEMETVIRDQPTANDGPGGPIAAPDLAQFLPAEDIRMQWNMRDLAGKVNSYFDFYAQLLDSTMPGLAEPMRSLLTDFARLGDAQTAVALSFDARSGMRGAAVWLGKDPDAYLAIIRRGIDMFNQPGLVQTYRNLGFDVSASVDPAGRSLFGWPVTRYRMSMVPSKDATPEQRKIFEKMPIVASLGNVHYEAMRLGSYVLFTYNRPMEALAQSLLQGRGDLPLRAAHVFPAGGTVYVDFDMGGFMRSMRGLLPAEATAKLPTPESVAGIVTAAVYDGGAAADYRVRVPRSVLTAFKNAK